MAKSKLRILSLGGQKEVGKNCMLLMHGSDALMIDCGIGFAGNDDFMDDDFFIPDLDAIEGLNIKLHGLVITHGHEDHIGAVPYFLDKFDVPVYMTEFADLLLKERISRVSKYNNVVALPAKRKAAFDVGPFNIRMLPVPHSIPESKALLITVGEYRLLHTSDFRSESTARSPFFQKINEEIDIMFVDSTNIEDEGFSQNESDIIDNIREIIANAQGRVIATAFSSNTVRIKNIMNLAVEAGRTVALLGRSVNQYAKIAEYLGYLKIPENAIFDRSKISRVPDNKLLMIVTGSQAEPRSVMKRMSLDMLKSVTVKYGDTIFFSSKIIPGNEVSIGRMLDQLVEKGVNLFYENNSDIHVSGHARKSEIVQAIKDVNPKLVIPVHGHLRFLDLNARTAEKNGFQARMISDGDVFEYSKEMSGLKQRIELETKIVSNYDPTLIDLETLKDRKRLARTGFLAVMMSLDFLSGRLIHPPVIFSSGVICKARMKKVEKEIREMVYDFFTEKLTENLDKEDIEEEIRVRVRRYLTSITDKKPTVYSKIVNASGNGHE